MLATQGVMRQLQLHQGCYCCLVSAAVGHDMRITLAVGRGTSPGSVVNMCLRLDGSKHSRHCEALVFCRSML